MFNFCQIKISQVTLIHPTQTSAPSDWFPALPRSHNNLEREKVLTDSGHWDSQYSTTKDAQERALPRLMDKWWEDRGPWEGSGQRVFYRSTVLNVNTIHLDHSSYRFLLPNIYFQCCELCNSNCLPALIGKKEQELSSQTPLQLKTSMWPWLLQLISLDEHEQGSGFCTEVRWPLKY